ncbi:MAG: hypothetical protein AAB403_16520 [Planctomycetota bacterium]
MLYPMRCIKKDAPPELVEAIRRIEERADGCFGSLALLKLHSNVAVWAPLVGGIRMVEQEIAHRGDNTADLSATLQNVSRFVPVAMKWAIKHGKPPSTLATRRWTPGLAAKVEEALNVAYQYSGFETCLPMWHRDRCLAELLSPALVRFTAPGTARNRQVSAYQKGFRPKEGSFKGQRTQKVDQTPPVQALFAAVLQASRKTGMVRFEYDDPWTLWLELLPEYQARVTAIARRADQLSLGDYTLRDFNQFYAAFLAICAAHEFLCFAWARNHGVYPLDSAVMVRSRQGWTAMLSELGGIPPGKCQSIISDLTFDFARSLDLHVHPFVPLDSAKLGLAVAPQFPLQSRPDENILRVCSILRPDVFDTTSLEKEPEILADLQKRCPRHALQGPVRMPKRNPDIDLIVTDENSSTIVIAELKWIRKTLRPVEIIDRDAEVLKGIRQLGQICRFLMDNADHLSAQGKLPRRLSDYEHIHYLLVARDHWLWVEPADGIAIVEFEAFSTALSRSENLHSAISDLLTYEWLPVEARDFTVQYDRATANGVSIESEVFYAA